MRLSSLLQRFPKRQNLTAMEKSQLADAGSETSHPTSLHQDQPSSQKEQEKEEVQLSNEPTTHEVNVTGDEAYLYLTGTKLAAVMTTVVLVAFLICLDSSIVGTAIPHITSQFHSIDDIGWYAGAYLLANCSLQLLTGKLYTHFHSKWVFLIFFGIFELGSLLCGVAVSSNMLIVGRAVAGMGGAGLTNGALTIVAASVPLHKRPGEKTSPESEPPPANVLDQYTSGCACPVSPSLHPSSPISKDQTDLPLSFSRTAWNCSWASGRRSAYAVYHVALVYVYAQNLPLKHSLSAHQVSISTCP